MRSAVTSWRMSRSDSSTPLAYRFDANYLSQLWLRFNPSPHSSRRMLRFYVFGRYNRPMTMIDRRQVIDASATSAYAHLFQALAEPTRLAVLQHLASGEHRVRDLVAHMGLAQSTVSKHLSFLHECGLIALRTEGRSSWYRLADPQLLADLIKAAERMLEASGTAHALCDHLHNPPATTEAASLSEHPVVISGGR